VVGVGPVDHLLDLRGVAAACGQQPGHLGQALLMRAGDHGDLATGRHRTGSQVGEYLGDRPGRDELGAHPRHVGHVAPGAPLHELGDELVELRGADHVGWDGPGQHGLLVCDFRGAVAGGEPVGADDGHHDDPPHSSPLAGLLEVAGRGGEEFRGGPLLRRWPRGRVNDGLHPGQGRCEAVPGDDVHSQRA